MSDWVPKVHPMDRNVEADDPLELMAEPVVGDPLVMLECIVQDFIWMGWSECQISSLFRSPEYPVLNSLLDHLGPAETDRRIAEIMARHGQWTFHATVVEPDLCEDEEASPRLVQIELPPNHSPCR